MEHSTIKKMMTKYSVLMSLIIAVILIVIATLVYPGGSLLDKNSIGFDWSKNFISNLFETKAINGLENPSTIWATIGMVFYSIGHGIFFINMSKKITLKTWSTILKYIGVINILLIFLIATSLHDLGVLSIVFTLLGFFIITMFIFKSKLHLLKFYCIICLLTYYSFFLFYGFGNVSWAAILQKVYILSSILLIVGLEYFTKNEDFIQTTSKDKKCKL